MRTVAVWTAFVLAYSSSPLVAGVRFIDPISVQSGNTGDITEKRVEPTCEELRAMWRYTKRQSRAAKTNTGYPLYPDSFTYNVWNSYTERAKPPLNYRVSTYTGRYTARPRNRAGGNAPVYGKIVHKVPAGSILRNGMRQSLRPFDKISPFYGTINAFSPSTRRHPSFRGGGVPPMAQVPQAGKFQHLKELLQAERARELKEQHKAEENEGKTFVFDDTTDDDYPLNMQQPRKQFFKSTSRIPPKDNYEFGQGRYTANVPNSGQAWSERTTVPGIYVALVLKQQIGVHVSPLRPHTAGSQRTRIVFS
ncbi:uncharacterized protein LOC128891815 isoform X1 [Hylaeus anthracinus]|uniref:uncharacterized protein LOC128891815 isoform X1 n=1 Tax=Hylaeus anthracinus TaxID=313031 RepID=UPI0023B902BE|nr:uncharacterized protein LOC128891815 isoform X1 [Hylaeus anthracinus]